MKLHLHSARQIFGSASQNARLLSEGWAHENMYCPNCGANRLEQLTPGQPVADFRCTCCGDEFELKCQKRPFGRTVVNGAYRTLVARLEQMSSPHLMLMVYESKDLVVQKFHVIPRRFFTPSVVQRRKPLAASARRAGWVGSNILLSRIPQDGLIPVVDNGRVVDKKDVLAQWKRTAFLERETSLAARGWLVDVMAVVDRIDAATFTLNDVYAYEEHLSRLYPENMNVRAKIRQQLQVLRDSGYLEFLGGGLYRKVEH